jgi:hypothetical protein
MKILYARAKKRLRELTKAELRLNIDHPKRSDAANSAIANGEGMKREIADREIAERAYLIWEREGRPEGKHLEHWRRAELELRELS